MKKYAQFTFVIVAFFLLVWVRQGEGNSEHTVALTPQQSTLVASAPPGNTLTSPAAPPPSATPTATPTPTAAAQTAPSTPIPAPKGQYRDGTYTGSVADAFYGNMQVQAVISGGRLTAVNILQYPNDNGTSRSINSQAIPILQSEALQAQSANIDMVSGASASSPAFQQSLQSALAQAS